MFISTFQYRFVFVTIYPKTMLYYLSFSTKNLNKVYKHNCTVETKVAFVTCNNHVARNPSRRTNP